MTARLLVVGASGLVGSHLVSSARAQGLEVFGAARTVRGEATHAADLEQRGEVEALLSRLNPDTVALCSAWPNVDGCEQDPARSERENLGTVRNVIEATRGARVALLWYSTDHVFDGSKAQHAVGDPVNPLSVYAHHKRAAEVALLERGRALVARTAWVFGVEAAQKNYVYRVIDHARRGAALRVPAAQAGTPTWAGWLAAATLELLGNCQFGVAHLVGPELLTKAAWARRVLSALRLPSIELAEVPWAEAGQIAPRPQSVRLAPGPPTQPHPALDAVLTSLAGALS